MPCYDSRDNYDYADLDRQIIAANKKAEQVSAMLCMVLSTLEDENELDHFKELFNYKESGVGRVEFVAWWRQHQEADAKRRQAEREAADRELRRRERKAARDKLIERLTPEELDLLGLGGKKDES